MDYCQQIDLADYFAHLVQQSKEPTEMVAKRRKTSIKTWKMEITRTTICINQVFWCRRTQVRLGLQSWINQLDRLALSSQTNNPSVIRKTPLWCQPQRWKRRLLHLTSQGFQMPLGTTECYKEWLTQSRKLISVCQFQSKSCRQTNLSPKSSSSALASLSRARFKKEEINLRIFSSLEIKRPRVSMKMTEARGSHHKPQGSQHLLLTYAQVSHLY